MCYQFIYYPSPNLFIKQLVIDKNHIVHYDGAVDAGLVTLLTWAPTYLDPTYLAPLYARIGNTIYTSLHKYISYTLVHIKKQRYFPMSWSNAKAKWLPVSAGVASGLGSANAHVTYLLQALLSYTFYKQFRIYCKHYKLFRIGISYFVMIYAVRTGVLII